MASLKEIAEDLGVSFSLVSKVLSGRMGNTGVSAATRKMIEDKARELDYRPNRLAVALKNGQKGSIAVFLHKMGTPGSELTSQFLDGLTHAFGKTNLRLWLRFFKSDEEFRAECSSRLVSEVDGLIVAGAEHPRLLADLENIDQKGLPVVSVFCAHPNCASPTNIAVDYRAQCYLTTKHLIERGCSRIAHFRSSGNLRHQGYIDAHSEAGLPVWPRLIQTADFKLEDGYNSAISLIESDEEFDAINCESDSQAIGAIKALRQRGFSVPEKVKVTGVDNSPLAVACEVPLTTVSSEMDICGKLAVETMLKKVAKEDVSPTVIQPKLIISESTGGAEPNV
ncbi:MAG: LacI family DNA-binding transcriptional regulator [Chthoniobacterales bacterium]